MEKSSKKENLETLRHSCSHVLAAAVLEVFGEVKLGIGPSTSSGFYYDFELPRTLTDDDLPKIQEEMKKIINEDLKFVKKIISKKQAKKIFKDQPFKLELLEEIPEKRVAIYKIGDFVDLCKGPHVKSTIQLGCFKLISVAGAYWKGLSTNPMLQRIYGTCFENVKDLNKYLVNLEEAAKRDHREIGKKLDLFSFHKEAPGAAFYHPKGKIIYDKLIELSRQTAQEYGFAEVSNPNVLDLNLWKTSGHFDHYRKAMFFVSGEDEKSKYALRPMGCPGMILIYKNQTRSFRDLPFRLNEFDIIFRKELSGTLHGLFRVQQFVQDDAHIFLAPKQIEDEVKNIIKSIRQVYKVFGLDYEIHLSTRPSDFMGKEEVWDKAETALKKALDAAKIKYQADVGEGAFYGPKIDFHIKDAMDRTWQCATIQLDFVMPEKFDLEYIDSAGKAARPVMIHRVILGSIDRFLGILLEHTAGVLPLWLAPVQVKVIPVAERHNKFAEEIVKNLGSYEVKAELNSANETVSKKIRAAELEKIPYILVVGDKEKKGEKVTVRKRADNKLEKMSLGKFAKKIKKEAAE